jgi:hypothetical protein
VWGLHTTKNGLRDRSSLTCTLSQNGYGDIWPPPVTMPWTRHISCFSGSFRKHKQRNSGASGCPRQGQIRKLQGSNNSSIPQAKNASVGNRTRVTSMATMYSTTRPLMLLRTAACLACDPFGQGPAFAPASRRTCCKRWVSRFGRELLGRRGEARRAPDWECAFWPKCGE